MPAPGGRPDVDLLMARVRAIAAQRLRSGYYRQEELEEIRRMEADVAARGSGGPDLEDSLSRLHASWDPTAPVEITSHRPVLGRVIVPVKRAAMRVLRPFARMALSRQAAFDGEVTRLLTLAVRRAGNIDLRLRELEREHRELLDRHRKLLRDVEETGPPEIVPGGAAVNPDGGGTDVAPADPSSPAVMQHVSYVAFEDRHRGTPEQIAARQRGYVAMFAGAPGAVLDAGCGRGEFLDLLREAGLPAYGVDADAEMIGRCLQRGLDVRQGDLAVHLRALPAASLGGIFAAQVVEHLDTPVLLDFIGLAGDKLAAGGRLVIETINPAALAAFSGAFHLDLTHVRPVHPVALRRAVEAAGFGAVEILGRSSLPDDAKMRMTKPARPVECGPGELTDTLNANFTRINGLIYGDQDYALVAIR